MPGVNYFIAGVEGPSITSQGKDGVGRVGRGNYPLGAQRSSSLPARIDVFLNVLPTLQLPCYERAGGQQASSAPMQVPSGCSRGQMGGLPHIGTLPLSPAPQPCSPWVATPTDSPASSRSASRVHPMTAAPPRAVPMATAGVAPPKTMTATRSTASAPRPVGVTPLPVLREQTHGSPVPTSFPQDWGAGQGA